MTAAILSGVEVVSGSTIVLPEVDVRLGDSEVLAVTGPSGSGKTTLLDVVLGLRESTARRIEVLGHNLSTMSVGQIAQLRRVHVGLVSQSADLLPELTVAENVGVGLIFSGMRRRKALHRAETALDAVGLSGAGNLRPSALSVGEAQRASIARALVPETIRLLVADEPTAALDADNVRLVMDVILSSVRDRGLAALIATHDRSVADRCDREFALRSHTAHWPR